MPAKAPVDEAPFTAYRGADTYVFVCYSHHDTAAVYDDLVLLRSAGVRIWYDEGISPGTQWSDELARALDGAALVLFYASSASTTSRHCRDEINFAHNRDKQILPIYLEQVALRAGLELSLSSTQAIHRFALSDEKYIAKMLDVLPAGAVESGEVAVITRPTRRRSPVRRYALASAAALLVALGIAGALNKDYVLSRWILYSAQYFGDPIEQHIGFAPAADGTRIAYATTGEGPPVLIVLGWATHLQEGINSPTYDPQGILALSSEKHRIIRYDGRGFGLSDRNIANFSLDARVNDIEAVVDALHLERFALYAMSAGGRAAIAYASRHPDKLVSLTLASSAADFSYADPQTMEAFRRMLDVCETSWDRSPAAIDLFIEMVFPDVHDAVVKEVLREFLRRAANGPDLAGFFRGFLAEDVSGLAEQIRVPTLVIHAQDDHTIPLEAGRRLASLVPNARYVIVPGGHGEGTGGTPETRKVILDFIDEVARSDAAPAQ